MSSPAATATGTTCQQAALALMLTCKDIGRSVAFYRDVAACTKRGLKASQPKTQFCGLRDFSVQDPEGFRFQFYSAVAMSEC